MSKDLIGRYIWIIDTLRRYRKLTKNELNELWMRSRFSDGNPLPDRTFYHYRRGIEDNFHIDIRCNSAGEYFIDNSAGSRNSRNVANMMLDSYAINDALKEGFAAFAHIEVEDVPSAREFLPTVLEAIERKHKIRFTYAGFNRSRAEHDIVFHPWHLKRYKQRWYMLGWKEKSNGIRTYALDRVREMSLEMNKFEIPEDFDPDNYFGNIIGVTTSHADERIVRLRVTPGQAKYFRALPLHSSQTEKIHDDYSVFTYRLKLNYELVSEITALGDQVKVLEPPELVLMVKSRLSDALSQYQ